MTTEHTGIIRQVRPVFTAKANGTGEGNSYQSLALSFWVGAKSLDFIAKIEPGSEPLQEGQWIKATIASAEDDSMAACFSDDLLFNIQVSDRPIK